MSLLPRATAVQGVGFAPRVLALQGFAPVAETPGYSVGPGAPRRPLPRELPRRQRRDTDDDVLLFLLR